MTKITFDHKPTYQAVKDNLNNFQVNPWLAFLKKCSADFNHVTMRF